MKETRDAAGYKKPTMNQCSCCGFNYRIADYQVCPSCGGDGGAVMGRVWKPTKAEKKAYAQKMQNEN